MKYRRSLDSADSISAVPGLVRIANRTILPKFPDLVRIANHSRPDEEALEKSNGVKQTKMTTFFTIVEQNTEKTGPSDQKFSKPPLKELDEALELLSD